MLKIQNTATFEKDLKRVNKRDCNLSLLAEVINTLAKEEPLQERYRDHNLSGNYIKHRECHIKPDWLLIYRIEKEYLILVRTGSHSDLF